MKMQHKASRQSPLRRFHGLGPWIAERDGNVSIEMAFLVTFLLVLVMGALGANVFTTSSFCYHLARDDFKRQFTPWYLLRPAIGAGMALVFYLLIRGGMITPGTGTEGINVHGIAGLAGLCGLFSQRAFYKLREVFTTLFRTRDDESHEN